MYTVKQKKFRFKNELLFSLFILYTTTISIFCIIIFFFLLIPSKKLILINKKGHINQKNQNTLYTQKTHLSKNNIGEYEEDEEDVDKVKKIINKKTPTENMKKNKLTIKTLSQEYVENVYQKFFSKKFDTITNCLNKKENLKKDENQKKKGGENKSITKKFIAKIAKAEELSSKEQTTKEKSLLKKEDLKKIKENNKSIEDNKSAIEKKSIPENTIDRSLLSLTTTEPSQSSGQKTPEDTPILHNDLLNDEHGIIDEEKYREQYNNFIDRCIIIANRFPAEKHPCKVTIESDAQIKKITIIAFNQKKQPSLAYKTYLCHEIKKNPLPFALQNKTMTLIF